MKEIINTENAPRAIGPYSQAIKAGGTVYVSGQLPIDPATGEFAGETIEEQTRQALENAKAILLSTGYTFSDVVKVTVLLDDIEDFVEMNEVYAGYFKKDPPARAAFEVARLPLGARIEIEMIAAK